jgi:outer membrane protein assembly factor BamB
MKMAGGWASVFASIMLVASVQAQDWPQWRGPNRDNKVAGFIEPKTWPKELTKKWTVKVGVGESSPVLAGGKVYAFAREGGEEILRCLDANTGKEIWQDKYATGAVTKNASGYPGPRSTPAVADGKICTLGVNGVISCLDAATGKIIWREDTKAKPAFNTSTSPLIVGDKLILYTAALTAYDLGNGKPKWTWKGGGPPYGSPVLTTLDGIQQIVTPTASVIAGVTLDGGKKLWDFTLATQGVKYQNSYSTPLIDGQTVIYFMTMGKGLGPSKGSSSIALKVEKKDDGLVAKEIWTNDKLYTDKYQAPVLANEHIFGITPGRQFFCMDPKTGRELWQDKTVHGECGAILNAGSVLLALTSDEYLIAFRPSAKEYIELAKYKVGDVETWATPIVAGKRIYIRDKQGSLTLWTME